MASSTAARRRQTGRIGQGSFRGADAGSWPGERAGLHAHRADAEGAQDRRARRLDHDHGDRRRVGADLCLPGEPGRLQVLAGGGGGLGGVELDGVAVAGAVDGLVQLRGPSPRGGIGGDLQVAAGREYQPAVGDQPEDGQERQAQHHHKHQHLPRLLVGGRVAASKAGHG
jgi:hypothetical protein